MNNSIMFLKGPKFSRPGWQRMFIVILLGFMPFLAKAQISNADAQALLQRHNQDRAQVGSPALCLNQQLMTAAENHCQDMLTHNLFSHTGFDGSDPGTVWPERDIVLGTGVKILPEGFQTLVA